MALSGAERNRRYRARHPERARAQTRLAEARRRAVDPLAATERVRTWREANRERDRATNRANAHRRRARLQGGNIEDVSVWVTALAQDVCSYCSSKGDTFDHITPLSRNGDHTWENLTAACKGCNGKKHARSLLFFLLESATI